MRRFPRLLGALACVIWVWVKRQPGNRLTQRVERTRLRLRTRHHAPYRPQALDNHACVLVPRVQAVMVGAVLTIQNSDPFLHTTRGRLPASKQAFNLVFPGGPSAKEQRIRFPGVIAVNCDTHAHMKAYITKPSPQKHYFSAPDFAAAVWTRKVDPHEVEIKGSIREIEVLPNGKAQWFFVPVQAGTFALHCYRPGHREAGMVGTLTVP